MTDYDSALRELRARMRESRSRISSVRSEEAYAQMARSLQGKTRVTDKLLEIEQRRRTVERDEDRSKFEAMKRVAENRREWAVTTGAELVDALARTQLLEEDGRRLQEERDEARNALAVSEAALQKQDRDHARIASLESQLAAATAHIDKLCEIFDDVYPCNDDCRLASILSWVDPADKARVRELRCSLRERLSAATAALALAEELTREEPEEHAGGISWCGWCWHRLRRLLTKTPDAKEEP